MSAAPLDERINARAQLQHVARGLFTDPTAALQAMRYEAHVEGAEAVRRNLERDFVHYGEARVRGTARERAQQVLRAGVAADVEGWLVLDHRPPQPQLVTDTEIERVLLGPDADATAHRPAAPADPREGLDPDERLAYERLEAYAEARDRAERRYAAEAQLHGINDHRANLAAAEESLPRVQNALKREVESTFRDGEKALDEINAAIERDGPAETARRIRSRDLLKREQKPIRASTKRLRVFPRRDTQAEADARERVAKRIETLGYYDERLKEWSTYTSPDGTTVRGAQNVRAALDRDEAKVLTSSGIETPARTDRTRPRAPHPSREASERGRAAKEQLARLSPQGRERVARAVHRSGLDKVGAALNHLQTLQMAARTFREGIEGPGH